VTPATLEGVPEQFHDFFVASAGVSGALIGLLFVASAVAPERIVQSSAPIRAQESAAGAYLVLVDTLFVALAALIPGNSLAVVVPLMAGIGIVGTLVFAGITVLEVRRPDVRWIWHRLLSLAFFSWQLVLGFQLATGNWRTATLTTLASLSLAFYAIGITRAWQLLGGTGHGILDGIALWRSRHGTGTTRE
jgi:hypothetical protein